MSRPGDFSRRQVVGSLAAAAAVAFRPRWAVGLSPASRSLGFLHVHTGERLAVEYFGGGSYHPDALAEVNHFLRDFRSGDVYPIDPGLLDLLHALQSTTGGRRPFQVISGYRSPPTNALLRRKSETVAAGSLHLKGQAIDIRVAGVALPQLRDAALELRQGGVGYYPTSDFVHLDTGRVRRW